jgi:hypothetical protein
MGKVLRIVCRAISAHLLHKAGLKLNDGAEETDAMSHIPGSSVPYRIAVGPQQGRKAFMIRTIRPLDRPNPGLERQRLLPPRRREL